ncbi:hypothetical protein [Rhodothermus profundi]|uniref:Outer membrane protein beta-barrel domain-containing protein n=1 Tax=Rhodothermus profundi TaxID=633813 RepID=A0A1M6Q1E0_9BACT|nr:hypothetical protein [Rhodothermus profundi]SHK14022.1 hypothetical protein SAMN04488087_0425 [Rhodothermus profundi]
MRRGLPVLLLLLLGAPSVNAQPLYFFGRLGVGQLLEAGPEGLWRPTAGLGIGLETPWPVAVESSVGGFTLRWRSPGRAVVYDWLSDIAFPPYRGRLWQLQFNLALRIRLLRYRRGELALGVGPSLRYIRRKVIYEETRCLSPYYAAEDDCVYWLPRESTRQRWETAGHVFLEAGLFPVVQQWGLGVFLESAAFVEGTFMAIGLRVVHR